MGKEGGVGGGIFCTRQTSGGGGGPTRKRLKTALSSAVSTPLWSPVDIQKVRYIKLFTRVESHASTVSLLENGE